MFATAILRRNQSDVPPAFYMASLLLWIGGHVFSASFTAAGLARAYRYGMRVWVGEGVNQARLLLLGMLIVGFTVAVLGPLGVWLAATAPHASNSGDVVRVSVMVGVMFGLMLGGGVVTLLILDWVSRYVVADRPGKFGPKVSAVGKWNS